MDTGTESTDAKENAGQCAPGISLVVLSYNQQAFIGDALRAALAQDCDPVEILISDDCSDDNTWGIIEETIRGYDGPHSVQARQNPENLGLVAHINRIFEIARGEIIIPAYGDDISLPNRVAEIAAVFAKSRPLLVHSDAIAIDETGAQTQTNYRKADFYRTTDPLDVATSMALYLGAAGAWHRSLFDRYGPIRFANVYDDHIFGFRAALEGRVAFIEKPLIKYREGIGLSHQLSNARSGNAPASARRCKILDMMISAYRQRLADCESFGLPDNHPVVRTLSRALAKTEMRRACHDGILGMIARNLNRPGMALSAAAAEGLRIVRRR